MISQGILYVATGDKYIKEAKRSMRSLRRFKPNIHATLITDENVEAPEFDTVKIFSYETTPSGDKWDKWKKGILFREAAIEATPYQKTLHVDTDTYFCDHCDELFTLLDFYDLLICHAPAESGGVTLKDKTLEGYTQYNTGVIAYNNNEQMTDFLKKRREIYEKKFDEYSHAQGPFMEALLESDVKTYALPSVYNFRFPFFVTVIPQKVKILHGHASDEKTYEEIANKINKRIEHRVWLPNKRKVLYYSDRSLFHRWYRDFPEPVKKAFKAGRKLYKKVRKILRRLLRS